MVVAIVIVFAVGFVVLVVIADQIVQGEPIVRGHEVNARVGTASAVLIQVRAAGETVRDLTDVALIALPKMPDHIAVFAVPFRPQHRKISDLISPLADIPRLRD